MTTTHIQESWRELFKKILSEIDLYLLSIGLIYLIFGQESPHPPSQWFGAALLVVALRGYVKRS